MEPLEVELERARALDVSALADAIESIGFECTRCGACCKGYDTERDSPDGESDGSSIGGEDGDAGTCSDPNVDREPHTATVFPGEIRELVAETDAEWRDVARPMPYGIESGPNGPEGETFEWALQTDSCGDCTFYRESDGVGRCSIHDDRPLICRTYPFSVALGGTSQPMGEAVDREGILRAHECEGLGGDIDRDRAVELARELQARAVRELQEAIEVRDAYEPVGVEGVVVHDSDGAKRPDGRPIELTERGGLYRTASGDFEQSE
ncbi:MAG: YkgJ family cysteine cluster protein [Halobacteriota archaeon]